MEKEKKEFPQLSKESKMSDANRVQLAMRNIHAGISDLLRAGRIANMDAARAIINDFDVLNERLKEIDLLAQQVIALQQQAAELLKELEDKKAASSVK